MLLCYFLSKIFYYIMTQGITFSMVDHYSYQLSRYLLIATVFLWFSYFYVNIYSLVSRGNEQTSVQHSGRAHKKSKWDQSLEHTVWECNKFPASGALDDCDWKVKGIDWGKHNLASAIDPSGQTEQRVLSVRYPVYSCISNQTEKGGCQFKSSAFGELESASLQYDIFFSKNFDFVWGGKLPGFFGGYGSCSGGLQGEHCFSTRLMWRLDGYGEMYGYLPNENRTWFCDLPENACDYRGFGHSLANGTFQFIPGHWHTVKQHIKLNSPKSTDGDIQIMFDGKLVYELNGIIFRRSSKVLVNALYFSTFFGGSWDEWRSTRDVYIYFRNFKIGVP